MLWAATWLAGTAWAQGSQAELVNEGFRVPPHEYRFVSLSVANWPATVTGVAEVLEGSPVRLELVRHRELGNFVRGRNYEFLLQVNPKRTIQFRQAVPEKGEYDLVLINDQELGSNVRLQVSVEFAREPDVARYLSPQRRLVVITVSLLVFLAIFGWSAWALMRAMRNASRPKQSN